MSSLLEVPAQLALVLSLTASHAGGAPISARLGSDMTPALLDSFAADVAVGPYQFGERTWIRALKEDENDTGDVEGLVFRTSGGRYYIPAASERNRILVRRRDDALAGRIARSFAERNVERLRAPLKRVPTAADLYLAHLFGPEAALIILRHVEAEPAALASARLPELVRAAPGLVHAEGVPLTFEQTYQRLTQSLMEAARRGDALAAEQAVEPMTIMKPTITGSAQLAAQAPGASSQ